MKRHLAALAVSAAIAQGSMPARAADPDKEICDFAASLGGGTPAVIAQLGVMASMWGAADRAKLGPIMEPEIGKFTMEPGKVFVTADLAPFTREYLVVTADRKVGSTLYFRVIYESGPKDYYFKNVDFNSKLARISEPAFLQKPEPMACP